MTTAGKSVEISLVSHYVQKQQITWFGHVTLLSLDSIPYKRLALRVVREQKKEMSPTQDMNEGVNRIIKYREAKPRALSRFLSTVLGL